MTQVTALPVGSAAPHDWWRRVSTAVNLLLGEVIDLYRRPVQSVTANYTFDDTTYAAFVDATTAALTVTLPAPTAGRELLIKKIDNSAHAVTVSGLIDGATSKVLSTQWQSLRLIGHDGGWYAV